MCLTVVYGKLPVLRPRDGLSQHQLQHQFQFDPACCCKRSYLHGGGGGGRLYWGNSRPNLFIQTQFPIRPTARVLPNVPWSSLLLLRLYPTSAALAAETGSTDAPESPSSTDEDEVILYSQSEPETLKPGNEKASHECGTGSGRGEACFIVLM